MFKPVILGLGVLLTGCSTIYHPQEGWVPEGYRETRLDGQTYTISFQSYQREDWEILQACLIYRAAQLGMEQQFSGFALGPVLREEHIDSAATAPGTGVSTIAGQPFTGANKDVYGAIAPVYVMEHKIRTLSAQVKYLHEDTAEYRVADVRPGLCPL